MSPLPRLLASEPEELTVTEVVGEVLDEIIPISGRYLVGAVATFILGCEIYAIKTRKIETITRWTHSLHGPARVAMMSFWMALTTHLWIEPTIKDIMNRRVR